MKIDIAVLQNAVKNYINTFEQHKANPLNAETLHVWDAADAELSSVINNDETNIIISLLEQLEAAQKESDVYAKLASDVGDIITLLQNNEWAEHIGKTNVGGLLEYQITRLMNSIADINTKLLAAEAALSAANEKLSKPVVLLDKYVRNEKGQYILDGKCEPRIGFAVGWNAAIRAAGGKVEGNADAE
ncbi:hypothetical protein [Yersinia canariae]|uniref:hypothetical protein n=1 Tax=Yersinia canariae TaxID=2607663 RepID=UPI00119CD54B|nr:hypothetical protein [Yersinia canariae]